MEATHRIVMNTTANMAMRDGLELSPVEDFSGKGSCIWLTNSHDIKVCFFVQGIGSAMRCGFLIPDSEKVLMELLDLQITSRTVNLRHRFQTFNHSMNRSSVKRGDRANSRIYLDYQDIGFDEVADMSGAMYAIIKTLLPAITTYTTLRGLIDFKLQIAEAMQ